jgi:hypothetical protein
MTVLKVLRALLTTSKSFGAPRNQAQEDFLAARSLCLEECVVRFGYMQLQQLLTRKVLLAIGACKPERWSCN